MLDVSVSYNRYKFLGYEYLTWLWFAVERQPAQIERATDHGATLRLGNRIVLENNKKDVVESITIKGDDAGLEEGMLALRKGAVVTELNLILRTGDQDWRFTVKGESLHIVGFKCPKTGVVDSQEDLEGAVLEKVFLSEQAIQAMDKIFRFFIGLRVSDKWGNTVVGPMKKWIRGK
jgi:hypothetical protein